MDRIVSSLLHQLAGEPGAEQLSDCELLERIAGQREPGLLAVLVQRHAALVWRVCRNVLGDVHESEDSFQATFLILVRRAGTLARRELLAPWLHGVAVRVALRARARLQQRRQRARTGVEEMSRSLPTHDESRDVRPILDEEIARLPERDRRAVILFHLEGKSAAETARLVGCSEGNLRVRLNRARERLRQRLTRRGLTVASAGFAALLGQEAAATPPAPLLQATIAGLTADAAGLASFDPNIQSLAREVTTAMLKTKTRIVVACCLVVGLALGATGLLAMQGNEGDRESKATAAPAVAKEERSLFQGVWKVVSAVEEGRAAPAEVVSDMRWDFQGDRFSWRVSASQIELQGSFRLQGRNIDFVRAKDGEVFPGIYKFEKNQLVLCFGEGQGGRPDEFKADRRDRFLLVLVKVPDKSK